MVVHDRGSLWEAVRASVSLPGILPPFARGLHLLVDGSVINNLPGDVMRQRGGGSVIAVNVSSTDDLRLPPSGIPSEWQIFWNKLLPFTRPVLVPGLAAIVMRTLLLASANRTALVERDADLVLKPPLNAYGLLEFKKSTPSSRSATATRSRPPPGGAGRGLRRDAPGVLSATVMAISSAN